jgi:hypothetical protein
MSSAINTNGLNTNYPVPGVNNNSQGFRNNFQNIKTNLETASAEITDLQDSVVVKNSIGTTPINNDMGNVLISNAATLNFRATTYNLGSALTGGPIVVDLALADVHYGILAGNILLSFGNWAPTGTLSKVTIELSTSNVSDNYSIGFPGQVVVANDNSGGALLNNFVDVNGTPTISFPHNCTQLDLECYSTDCGNTVYITPINRPYQSTQIVKRSPPSTGQYGDMAGTVCVDPAMSQLTVTGANTDPYFVTSNTASLYTGLPVIFTGTSLESNVVVGNTYYVRNVVSNTTFTLSSTVDGANIAVASNVTGNTMFLNPVRYMYVATDNYNSAQLTNPITAKNIGNTTAPNIITLTSSASLNGTLNMPIMFTGNIGNTGLETDQVYYIKSISSSNITVSQTRYNGIAGPEYTSINTVANVTADANIFVSSDIFRRIPLQPF